MHRCYRFGAKGEEMCNKSDIQQKPFVNWFKHDPIESDPEMQPILAAAAEEARAELLAAGKNIGWGHARRVWHVKQRILREKYQIEWKSPADLNPECDFS